MTDKFWVTGGDGLYGSVDNWSATSGGGSGVAIPAIGDDVFFDSSSGSGTCTVNTTTNRLANNLDFTGFTGTFTVGDGVNGQMDIGGNLIMDSGATYTASAGTRTAVRMHIFSGATIFTDGATMPWHLILDNGTTGTISLLDDIVCSATVQISISDTSAWTLNGFSIECQDDLYYGVGTGTVTGSTLLKCTGTADLLMNGQSTNYAVELDVEFTSGTRTLRLTGGVSNCDWTYVAGTVTVNADWHPHIMLATGTWNFDIGSSAYTIDLLTVVGTPHTMRWTNTANDCIITDVHVNTGIVFTMDNGGNTNPIYCTSYGDPSVLFTVAQHFIGDFTFKDFFCTYTTSAGSWTWDHTATYIFEDRCELLKTDTGFMTWGSTDSKLRPTFIIWHNARTHLYGLKCTRIDGLSSGQGFVVNGETAITGSLGVQTENMNIAVKGLNGTTPIDHPFYVDPIKTPVTISGTVQLSAADREDAIVIIISRTPTEGGVDWYKLINVLVTDVNGDWSCSVPSGVTVTATAHYDDGTKHNSLSLPYVVAS